MHIGTLMPRRAILLHVVIGNIYNSRKRKTHSIGKSEAFVNDTARPRFPGFDNLKFFNATNRARIYTSELAINNRARVASLQLCT